MNIPRYKPIGSDEPTVKPANTAHRRNALGPATHWVTGPSLTAHMFSVATPGACLRTRQIPVFYLSVIWLSYIFFTDNLIKANIHSTPNCLLFCSLHLNIMQKYT